MCGIAGIIDFAGGAIDANRLRQMRDIMTSRGPDAAGEYFAHGVALGHRRLAIIDLSERASQPMANEDGTVHLVFNGEIYNFVDLRTELINAGHQFRSDSDSEVIIHGYEAFGLAGLCQRLRGMYAIAIWDANTRSLHLARDPVGKKPLFYRRAGTELTFASDAKAIWEAAGRDLAINREALDDLLYYYFITPSRSIFSGVEKVEPGTWLTVSGETISRGAHWRPDFSNPDPTLTDASAADMLEEHLRTAVQRRLVADVPLGAFLSAGVDSGMVCALMAETGQRPPQTFTAGFPGAGSLDESGIATETANRLGTRHQNLPVAADASAVLTELVWQMGEPFADASLVPTYLIAQAAREHVTVVLTGDGGDEAFAGYPRYRDALRARHLSALPTIPRMAVGGLAAFGKNALPRAFLFEKLALRGRYLVGDSIGLATFFNWWDGLRDDLYTAESRRALNGFHPVEGQRGLLASLTGPDYASQMLEYIIRVRLPGDYLTKVDTATMAVGLEARCPFLDVDVLDACARVPVALHVTPGEGKRLLRRLARNRLPDAVLSRRKSGFELPVSQWLATTWAAPVESLLLSDAATARGYFEPTVIRRVLTQHREGRIDHGMRIWTLLIFELWNRIFVDGTLKRGEPWLPPR